MIQVLVQFDPATQEVRVQSQVPPHVAAFLLQKAMLALANQPLKAEGAGLAVPNGPLARRLLEGK